MMQCATTLSRVVADSSAFSKAVAGHDGGIKIKGESDERYLRELPAVQGVMNWRINCSGQVDSRDYSWAVVIVPVGVP